MNLELLVTCRHKAGGIYNVLAQKVGLSVILHPLGDATAAIDNANPHTGIRLIWSRIVILLVRQISMVAFRIWRPFSRSGERVLRSSAKASF